MSIPYISISQLQREQNQLSLDLIKYTLDEEWRSSELITSLRSRIIPRMPKGLFDPQDLEHQVLFRLTTFSPDEINDELIDEIIVEQRLVIEDRLRNVSELEYLFRGFNTRNKDLNINERLELKHEGGRLYATGHGRILEVEFRKITDESIIKLFTEKLHYIHSGRHKGDTFGFFFQGDDMPWGVETTEPSIGAKKYKRDALVAHGIDPSKAIEITRLYLLPGSPKNAISIMDGLVAKYYKRHGIEAMYTTTMPMYAKTRGATTAGGMRDVLLVKELSHNFKKQIIDGKSVYVHDVTTQKGSGTLSTHPMFPTLLTVETFMRLNTSRDIAALNLLKGRVIYVPPARRRSEQQTEMRFTIKNVSQFLDDLKGVGGKHIGTLYVADSFWGYKSLKKLRLRKIVHDNKTTYESSSKYRLSSEEHIRTIVNDVLYSGDSEENAISAIKISDVKYKKENSYEKVRFVYQMSDVVVYVDIYPFGALTKVIGEKTTVRKAAQKLGFKLTQDVRVHADDVYLEWRKRMNLPELWEVTFGLESGH